MSATMGIMNVTMSLIERYYELN